MRVAFAYKDEPENLFRKLDTPVVPPVGSTIAFEYKGDPGHYFHCKVVDLLFFCNSSDLLQAINVIVIDKENEE